MLVQCEPIVSDTGPTLGERLVLAGLCHITAAKKCYVNERFLLCRGTCVCGFYLLISNPLIPYTLGAFSQRWGNVLKRMPQSLDTNKRRSHN